MTEFSLKETIILHVQGEPSLSLRAVKAIDIEVLRLWKNEQKESFFHKEEITSEQQDFWFLAFRERPKDFIFICEFSGRKFGCMGIRWQEGSWDVYNVILGCSELGGRGLMSKAFIIMLDYSISVKLAPISLQVLRRNPAVNWYLKNGFVITAQQKDYYCMTYQRGSTQKESL